MLTKILPPLIVFIAFTVAIEAYVRLRHVPAYLLPKPSDVFQTLLRDRGELLRSLANTAEAALIGFAASAIVGGLAAIALAASPLIRRAFYPYTVFFQTVPIVAIAPLLVIWFDYGLSSVAMSAFIVSVFPVIANTLAGLLATDPALVDLFRLYGASPFAALFKLRLPSALPNILTGLRIAGGLAVIGTVVGEFLVGTMGDTEGLGVKVVAAMKTGHTDKMFAAVLIASILGLGLFAAVNLASHLMLRRWYAAEKN